MLWFCCILELSDFVEFDDVVLVFLHKFLATLCREMKHPSLIPLPFLRKNSSRRSREKTLDFFLISKGCFLNLVATFPLVNQWKMMSTITKNIQNWESFEGKFEKFVHFEENICHLSFNSRKGTKRKREISKIHEKITLFRRKM